MMTQNFGEIPQRLASQLQGLQAEDAEILLDIFCDLRDVKVYEDVGVLNEVFIHTSLEDESSQMSGYNSRIDHIFTVNLEEVLGKSANRATLVTVLGLLFPQISSTYWLLAFAISVIPVLRHGIRVPLDERELIVLKLMWDNRDHSKSSIGEDDAFEKQNAFRKSQNKKELTKKEFTEALSVLNSLEVIKKTNGKWKIMKKIEHQFR